MTDQSTFSFFRQMNNLLTLLGIVVDILCELGNDLSVGLRLKLKALGQLQKKKRKEKSLFNNKNRKEKGKKGSSLPLTKKRCRSL